MRHRILLVDDNPPHFRLISRALESLGYEVSNAPNCSAALEMIQESPPSLVLLDIKYPKMFGRTFFDAIKSVKSDLPVITMAGLDDEVIAQLVGKVCGAGFILKPVDLGELDEKIRKNLEPIGAGSPLYEASAARPAAGWAPAFSG